MEGSCWVKRSHCNATTSLTGRRVGDEVREDNFYSIKPVDEGRIWRNNMARALNPSFLYSSLELPDEDKWRAWSWGYNDDHPADFQFTNRLVQAQTSLDLSYKTSSILAELRETCLTFACILKYFFPPNPCKVFKTHVKHVKPLKMFFAEENLFFLVCIQEVPSSTLPATERL